MSPVRLALSLLLVVFGAGACKGDKEETEAGPEPSATAIEVPSLDTAALTPRERRELTAQLNELLAPCPEVAVSVAECIAEKRDCAACRPAADFLLKQVQAGMPQKKRAEVYKARFDPKEKKTISLDDSPQIGPDDAPITIVEWADFECPFCKLVSPAFDDLVERFDGQVRFVYKFYPLKTHPNGEIAARAAIAANNQGKFWEMHHLLFDNQGQLARPDLVKLAEELGLDIEQFKKDLTADATTERIERDMKQADSIGLEGTPMIYINGRSAEPSPAQPYKALEEWVLLDLELMGKKPNDPPADFKPTATGAGAKPDGESDGGGGADAEAEGGAEAGKGGAGGATKPAGDAKP